MLDILLLLGSLFIILFGCHLFTQGVEWIGRKFNLGEGAVGSVLAGVGTAMPETLIPIVAFISAKGSNTASEIGIGAILGAPLLLATLAFFLTGLSVIIFSRKGRRKPTMNVDHVVLGRDLKFFFIVYLLAISVSWFHFLPLIRWIVAFSLVLLYLIYIRITFSHRGTKTEIEEDSLDPLFMFKRHDDPHKHYVFLQTAVGLALIIVGAKIFVSGVEHLALILHLPAFILALIIAPIATELPEKMNSILWVRQGKDTLALGNISGAMVFQSSVVPAVGIICTEWILNTEALVSAGAALLAAGVVWLQLKVKGRVTPSSLMFGGLVYVIYLTWVLFGR